MKVDNELSITFGMAIQQYIFVDSDHHFICIITMFLSVLARSSTPQPKGGGVVERVRVAPGSGPVL